MRFLVDECTGPAVAEWLRQHHHDVVSVYEQAQGSADDAIIQRAVKEDRILLTNDKDFGEKVYRDKRSHEDVILLRLEGRAARFEDCRPLAPAQSVRREASRFFCRGV